MFFDFNMIFLLIDYLREMRFEVDFKLLDQYLVGQYFKLYFQNYYCIIYVFYKYLFVVICMVYFI